MRCQPSDVSGQHTYKEFYMFFQPKTWEKVQPITIHKNIILSGLCGYATEVLRKAAFVAGTENGITTVLGVCDATLPPEAYTVTISDESITIFYSEDRGMLYAAVTILQMVEHKELYTGSLSDAPDVNVRGYRGFLPGRRSLSDFYYLVDMLAYYKYNTIFLEVGGAMEYLRHPEINTAWKAYADETHRYSGRSLEIQNGYDWAKDAIHTDNGEGEILSQEEVRSIVAYCESRGLTVYPEVPLFSHADYLCLAHPEIAERKEDPYPDTYCPNHPDTYPLVFDVLEEVIDVFHPAVIHIGHDELYSIALCPRCADKKPEDIYADDIIKIHDFLKQRGIRTAMWGEKLLPVITRERCVGGLAKDAIENGHRHCFPALFLCQQRIPKDVLILHWFYPYGIQYDFVYHTQGLEAIFGNLDPLDVEDWRLRIEKGIRGGVVSNWGSYFREEMQRNGQYRQVIFSAYAMWHSFYDTPMKAKVMKLSYEEAYRYHFSSLPSQKRITVDHTTDAFFPYKWFVDGEFVTDIYKLGDYVVTYEDGTTMDLEVKYGKNISHHALPMLFLESGKEKETYTFEEAGSASELCYSAMPYENSEKVYYQTIFENPYPEKNILSIAYRPSSDHSVYIKSIHIGE